MLNEQVFATAPRLANTDAMSVNGVVNKTFFLTILLVLSAGTCWNLAISHPSMIGVMMWGGLIGGVVLFLAAMSKPTWSPVIAPIYGVFEGGVVGTISYMYRTAYDGIVLQAALITVGILLAVLVVYRSGLVQVTAGFKRMVYAATIGVGIVYLATIVLGFFGVQIPFIHNSGMIGIGFSLFVIGVASMNLVIDFDTIENGVRAGAPKYLEWQAGLGLLVTLVWLYIEVLRLLAKLNNRR